MSTATIGHTSVRLLGCFELMSQGTPAHLPMQAQRVIAYLAVTRNHVNRHDLAGRLWPFSKQGRAQGNLRTAVWRIRQEAPAAIDGDRELLGLGGRVDVDYHDLLEDPHRDREDPPAHELVADLRLDLLPGWDEEWLIVERERARQLRMRKLEAISRQRTEDGDVDTAIRAAYSAIEIEPLRESARLALIDAHVADGNLAEAIREVRRFDELLFQELEIAPSPAFNAHVTELGLEWSSRPHVIGSGPVGPRR